jgi:hypothetical protein
MAVDGLIVADMPVFIKAKHMGLGRIEFIWNGKGEHWVSPCVEDYMKCLARARKFFISSLYQK